MYIRSITFRCRPSSVRALLDSLSEQLTEEIKDYLRQLNIFQFTEMPPFQQEAPLTIQILSCWNVKKQVFYIAKKELSFTADEVALIIGMPNRGEEVTWSSTLSKKSSIDIRNTFAQQTITNTDNFVTLYIQFLLTNLFFPNNNYKVHEDLINVATKVKRFSKYNWPKAIWRVLLNQFDSIGMKFQNKKPLGYIRGFVTVLVLWFFEHCQVVTPSSTTATPRMMRWGKAVAWSTIRCADIFASLEQHQVFERFQGVSEDELELLATEENIPYPSPTPTPSPRHVSPTISAKSDNRLQIVLSGKTNLPTSATHIFESPLPSTRNPPSSSSLPSATDSPFETSLHSERSPPPSSPTIPSTVDLFISFKNLESKSNKLEEALNTVQIGYNKLEEVLNNVQKGYSKLEEEMNSRMSSFEEKIKDLDRRVTNYEKRKRTTPIALISLIRGIKSRQDRKRKLLISPYVSGQQKRRRQGKRKEVQAIQESKADKQISDIIIDNEAATVLLTIQEALDTNVDMKVITKNNDVEDEDGNPKDHVDVEIEQEKVACKDNESVDVEIDQNMVAFKNNQSVDVEIELDKGHHEMKRSFPWEEAVTISDSDSEEDKQDRAKRDKKDCSSENLKDITSEGTLIRMAGMYQEYMKRIPIPTFSGSIVPFTSWLGLAKSLKQLYGQPLHYLTNALLKQWDRERFGSDNELQPLDAVVHPVKAQTLIWLTEELHRLTASPYHLAKLWACDPMYHSQIDPFLSY